MVLSRISGGAAGWLCVLAVGCGGALPAAKTLAKKSLPAWASQSSPLQIELPSGLTIVLHENRAAPVVALQAWVAGGSAAEDFADAGVAHVVQRVLFAERSAAEEPGIRERVAGLGGRVDAWTSADDSVFEVVVASSHAERGVALLAAALADDHFEPAELDRQRDAVLAEISRRESDASLTLVDALRMVALDGRPYARPSFGRTQSVRALDVDKMRSFYARHYAPNNVTLVVSGDFDRVRLMQAIEKMWPATGRTSWRAKKMAPLSPQQSVRAVVETLRKHEHNRDAQVKLAFRIPGMAHADAPAVRMMAVVLDQRVQDLLHSTGLSSRVRVSPEPAGDDGLLVIHAVARRGDVKSVVRALAEEAFRLGRETPQADDVALARSHLAADDAYAAGSIEGVAYRLAMAVTLLGDLSRWDMTDKTLRAVTADDVRDIAARTLLPERATVAVTRAATDRELREETLIALVNEAKATAERTPQKTQAKAVVRHRLPNGMTLLIRRDTSAQLVAMRAAWRGGQRYESKSNNGSAQLFARLLTQGTQSRSRRDVVDEIERMSGTFVGFAGRDSLSLHIEAVSTHWSHALELLADSVRNPAFTKATLEKERRAAIERVHDRFDDWQAVAFQLFLSNLYERHPYRMPPQGETASLAGVTSQSLHALRDRHYSIDKMTLAIVGDVDVDRVVRKAKLLFAGPAAAANAHLPVPKQVSRVQGGVKEVYTFTPTQEVHAVIGFAGATVDSPDRVALHVLTALVSRNRIVQAMQGDGGRVVHLETFSVEGLDPGYVGVYLVANPDTFAQVLLDLRKTIARLVQKTVSARELARAKQFVVGKHAMSLRRRADMASAMALGNVLGADMSDVASYRKSVNAIDAAELQRVARAYLDWSRAVVAVVKPEEMSPGATRRAAGTVKKRKEHR